MAKAYTKEFLIDAFLSRFINSGIFSEFQINSLKELAVSCYDKYGKDKFRVYASLDAEAIRNYKMIM